MERITRKTIIVAQEDDWWPSFTKVYRMRFYCMRMLMKSIAK